MCFCCYFYFCHIWLRTKKLHLQCNEWHNVISIHDIKWYFQAKCRYRWTSQLQGAEQLACLTGGWHWSSPWEGALAVQWHCPHLCGPLYMSSGGLPGQCHRLRSKRKVETAWQSQVTAGIGGHTCHHTVNLLESWTPQEWQWWPQAGWQMYQAVLEICLWYLCFKSISVVGNVIDSISHCHGYIIAECITFRCTKMSFKIL